MQDRACVQLQRDNQRRIHIIIKFRSDIVKKTDTIVNARGELGIVGGLSLDASAAVPAWTMPEHREGLREGWHQEVLGGWRQDLRAGFVYANVGDGRCICEWGESRRQGPGRDDRVSEGSLCAADGACVGPDFGQQYKLQRMLVLWRRSWAPSQSLVLSRLPLPVKCAGTAS